MNIITGHSRGVGKSLTELYLAQNHLVLGISRNMILENRRLKQSILDLSDPVVLENWLKNGILEDFIKDAKEIVLINNAATIMPSAVSGKQRPSEIVRAVNLNITAPLMLSNYLLSQKTPEIKLKVIHIGSGAGNRAYIGWSVYGATKAALEQHIRCMDVEKHNNAQFAYIIPGVVDTPMQEEIRHLEMENFPELPRFLAFHQHGELSSPEQVAQSIIEIIEHEDFGSEIMYDVRHWQALKSTDFICWSNKSE